MRNVDTISVICFNCDSLLGVFPDSEHGMLAAEQNSLRKCDVCSAKDIHRMVLSVDAKQSVVPRIYSRIVCDCGACVLDTSYCLNDYSSPDRTTLVDRLRDMVGQVKCPNCESYDRQYLEADLPF